MPFLAVGSVRLWYEVTGESGSPVVLVMGLGLPGSAWAPQLAALSPAHRVLTFDSRGIGRSSPVEGWPRIEELGGDVLRLMDAAGLESAHLAGISMGSRIALAAALGARERVRSLTLLSSWSGRCLWWPTLAAARWTPAVVFRHGPAQIRALAHQILSRRFLARVDRAVLYAQMQQALGPRPPVRTVAAQLGALLRYDARAKLDRLAGLPMLIVSGGGDILVPPRKAADLARRLPGSRRVELPGCGHGVTLEEGAEVNRLLAERMAEA